MPVIYEPDSAQFFKRVDQGVDPTEVFEPYITRRIRIFRSTATDIELQKRPDGKMATEFRVRYDSKSSKISADMRVLWRGSWYEVVAPPDYSATTREIRLACIGTAACPLSPPVST